MLKESDKRVARKFIKGTLSSLSDEKILEKSNRIGRNLIELLNKMNSDLPQKKLSTLGVYSPLKTEVNWLCVEKQLSCDWSLAYPSFSKERGMRFKAPGKGLELSLEFGVEILTPPEGSIELFPDVCLVPGLGFSIKGERLGRGRGFYDRYLSSFKGVTIALAFEEQILEEVPVEPHDELIEFLVSEESIYWQGEPYEFQPSAEDI